jgi:ComF family protein
LLSNTIKAIFDFFLPRFCTSCKNKLSTNEEIICENCFAKIENTTSERIELEYRRKFEKEKLISDFNSAFIFHEGKEIQKLIHSLKYDKNYQAGNFLGKITSELLIDKISSWKCDVIIPIPLHKLRKADRGFNQAKEIANGISKQLNIPLGTNILKRTRFTKTQTKLNLKERKENIEGAFQIRKGRSVKDKNIILVDDVITTGATISECAKILLANGANRIYAVSIAIAD